MSGIKQGKGTTGPRRAVRKPRRAVWWAGGAVAAAATAGVIFLARSGSAPSGEARPDAFPFPCLQTEGAQQHIHPYLRIFVNGQPVPVPAGIGIRSLPGGAACLEPLHTHDTSGIIHIESHSKTQTYTLADFFAIWRATYRTVEIGGASYPLSYTLSELFNHMSDGKGTIQLLVDGVPSRAGPLLVLNTLDYCSAAMAGPPCAPTATADPYPPLVMQRYGTGHTIVLQYRGRSSP